MKIEKTAKRIGFSDACRKVVLEFGALPGAAFLFGPRSGSKMRKMRAFIGATEWVKGDLEAFDWIERQRSKADVVAALGYEALHLFEEVPKVPVNNYETPVVLGIVHSSLFEIEEIENGGASFSILYDRDNYRSKFEACLAKPIEEISCTRPISLSEIEEVISKSSNFTREQYERAVDEIRELILDGEVYQVNLSQQIALPYDGSGATLLSRLIEDSIPLHGGVINDPEGPEEGKWSIVSASPESFLRQRNGGLLEASPIKGTRKSGASELERAKLCEELLSSPKDHAELSMIVDLMRNDLSRVSKPGTVEVTAHARLEEHGTVMHLVSDIHGELRSDAKLADIFRALFPSGSVTGAPKIAAMKEISRLEGTARGPYTGAFGTLGSDYVSLSVGIRTGLIRDGILRFQVGGGIVIDSVPEDEYIETLHKARVMVEAWKKR